jgi:hypothetical protein
MKRLSICVLACAALAVPMTSSALTDSYIDGYGVASSDVEARLDGLEETAEDEGDGAGIKARIGLGEAYLTGEYQSVEYDSDIELDQTRLGVMLGSGAGTGTGLYAGAEYVDFDFLYPETAVTPEIEEEQNGIAGHLGFGIGLLPLLHAYGQVGYVKLDDYDGPEFLVGASVQLLPFFGLFADYRVTDFEDDEDNELQFEDVRVGARLSF